MTLNANATCVDALNTDDTAIYCSGTCGELIDDVLNICPNVGDGRQCKSIRMCVYTITLII